ncbi:S-adenosyl-L-methionine-dependent methyltransferase [Mytilinidion resinicola]|uniref:S-adenosyl-L-methionine-dependent methyltransferase n=1 Tax=Mytilinidion resinicola TaxID=574789 RepID=A0A6A6YVQ9_9PEZI|nr:S-adenosyl-L-methionine-dependent methyltransferase [Mytilinidion resinicola]KAF2811997.1 S-adenosyl-L-methionine-dependent methyltransferase [Mytilinidion resinicola]
MPEPQNVPEEYSHVPSDSYILQRHYAASARLNLQHHLYRQAIGYLLHPSIPIQEDMKVADIACGTGIWLLDLADAFPPNAILDGFDISADQFPHESTLPPNVTFGVLDGMKEIPEELVGKYDVVRVSLIVLVVKDGEPGGWIENLMRLLKPGGYLQWTEGNMPAYIARHTTHPSDPARFPNMHAFEQFYLSMLSKQPPGIHDWVTHLGTHFEKHGLQEVEYKQFDVPKRYWPAWTDVMMLTAEEVS